MGLFSNSKTKKRDVFEARERQQRVWQYIGRLVDLSTPNVPSEQEGDRIAKRYNRCVPVGCVPMVIEDLDPNSIFYGSTKDFSDNGLSLITSDFVECTDIICGFWLDDLTLLKGAVRRTRPFGGNLYELGVEFSDVIDSAEVITVLKKHLRALVTESDAVEV